MQVAPHLVVLYDAIAVKDQPHLVEGDVIVFEDHADALMHIQSNLAVCERGLCTDKKCSESLGLDCGAAVDLSSGNGHAPQVTSMYASSIHCRQR